MLLPSDALAYTQQLQNGNAISRQDVEQLLQNVHGTTFAQLLQVTPVALAAAHKARQIYKVTKANVQLFNNLQAYTNAYENAVKRSATKLGQDKDNVSDFQAQSNWFEHDDCYSIVHSKKDNSKVYLFAIYNKADSVYVENNTVVDKQHVAEYMTASAAKELLAPSATVTNVTHGIEHKVHVRTTSLDNIVSIKAMGSQVDAQ